MKRSAVRNKITMLSSIYVLILAIGLIAAPFNVYAQAGGSRKNPLALTSSITPSPIHPGEIATVTVTLKIDSGWHVYSSIPSGKTDGPSPSNIVSAGNWNAATATAEDNVIKANDPNFGLVAFHEHTAEFKRQYRVPDNALGAASIPVVFHYETCNDKVCLPPVDITFNTPVTIEAGPVRTDFHNPSLSAAAATSPSPANGMSLAVFLLAAAGAGLLALITPCVFPLIPITLAGFVKQADGSRAKLTKLALGYASGIIILYVALGSIVAATLGAAGANRIAANPWVNLAEFVLFVVFALSFFETITLQLPASWSGIHSVAKKNSGTAGLLLMGVAFVLASFTCTAPFVGTLLVAAADGEKLRPLIGMFVFALAFTSPFIICAIFPQWITRIPKGGIWLARVKATLGFIELAAALKFLSNTDMVWQWKLLTQPVLLGLWAIILFCAFLYLVGLMRFGVVAETEPMGTRPSPSRLGFAGLFLLMTFYCFWGLAGRPIHPWVGAFLPPPSYGGVQTGTPNEIAWLTDYDKAFMQAKAENKLLFIDFTGYTCTNCRLNEKNVFPQPQVQQELSKFIRVQLYTDGGVDGVKNQKLQETRFNDVALPLYGIIDPASDKVIDKTAGVLTPDAFLDFLRKAQSSPLATSQPQGLKPALPMWSAYDESQIGKGKPVIIDFTADWCTNCKIIEKTVFEAPQVKERLGKEFVTMRSDMTNWKAPANAALQKQYGITNLPTILIFDSSGKEVKAARITERLSVDDFLKRIDVK